MPRVLLVIFLLLLLSLSSLAAANGLAIRATDGVVVIGIGESVRIDVKAGTRVHVSDGSVVRSRVLANTVIMTGRKMGRTTLRLVGDKTNEGKTLVVTARKMATTIRLFQTALESRRGLRISPEALPVIAVTGELLRIDDWASLVKIARETQIPWRLEATVFPKIRPELLDKIEAELRELAWPGQRLSIGPKGPTLTGGAESTAMTAQQKLAVTTLGLQIESSTGLIELEPMIRTQIVIAEVRRTRAQTLGIDWPRVAQASLLPSLQIPTESLLLNLKAIEDEGEGRILAMPTLSCRSGGEAKFLAGGEIPIKLTSFRSSQVEWKKYGITLHVQPRADRMKRMKFQLTTEISTLDKANEVENVPGILTNRIETQFNLSGPQTIVLSGLIKREEGEAASGIPLLRSIPVLGSLFGSENFRKALTELLIFVSPGVIVQEGSAYDDRE